MRRWVWWGHALLSIVLSGLAVVGVTIGIWLAYLAANPLDLKPYLPRLNQWLAADGLVVQAQTAVLTYDAGLQVRLTDFALNVDNYERAVVAEAVQLRLSAWYLLLGRVTLKSAHIEAPRVAAAISGGGLRVAGKVLRFYGQGTDEPTVDLVALLAAQRWWGGGLSQVEGVTITRGVIEVTSPQLATVVQVNDVQATFQRPWVGDDELKLQARLQYAEQVAPVALYATYDDGPEHIALQAAVKDFAPEWLTPLLPPQWQQVAQGKMALAFFGTLRRGGTWVEPQLQIRTGAINVNLPMAYDWPLQYQSVSALLSYDPARDGGTLSVPRLQLVDQYGARATGQVTLSGLNTTPMARGQRCCSISPLVRPMRGCERTSPRPIFLTRGWRLMGR